MKWLLKTEPGEYSWDAMLQDGVACWDGVRNFQAQNNMKSMKMDELAFFYQTGKSKSVIGIVKVVKEFYLCPGEEKLGMVDVRCCETLNTPVPLSLLKRDELLSSLVMLQQSRLSVVPITDFEWDTIISISSIK